MTKHDADFEARSRKATNVSLNVALVAEAKRLGLNLSRACEAGLSQMIAREHERRWREENHEALASSNRYVEQYGLPLARYRQF